jgi:hypothetical protein
VRANTEAGGVLPGGLFNDQLIIEGVSGVFGMPPCTQTFVMALLSYSQGVEAGDVVKNQELCGCLMSPLAEASLYALSGVWGLLCTCTSKCSCMVPDLQFV